MDIKDFKRRKEELEIEMKLAIIHSEQVCHDMEIRMKEINRRARDNMKKLEGLLAII